MKCRMNVSDLTPGEKSQLAQAFLDLKNPVKSPSRIPAAQAAVTAGGGTPNRYDDYVWLHNTVSVGAHRGPAFGPWHREFLHQIEYDLQQVSGNPELTLPYWDWTTARSSADAGWPFANDLMGGFGNAGPGPTTGYVTTGPFANPATWRVNIRRTGDTDIQLKRSRGVPAAGDLPLRNDVLLALGVGVAPGATWPSVYDATPWNDFTNPQPTSAQVLASFRKYLERLLHDGVHVWVGDAWEFNAQGQPQDGGHMTFPAVAVNDPVFWLHHCNVDRLWAIWQRKVATSGYLPQVPGSAAGGHNGGDTMVNLANPAWFNTALHTHPNDVQDHQALDFWFHTDVPEVTLDTPSVAFGQVPELRTTYMPVMFSVRTCREVNFDVTAVTGAGFSEPADQGVVVVDHDHANDLVTARVYVGFTANGPLNTPATGTATVVASMVDEDGYDTANPGDSLVLGTWTVDLTATPVPRPRAAIELVLDRSGSMAASAGAAGTRYDMLKSSLAVVRDVMRPLDGVGVVTFDDVTVNLNPITEMGPEVSPPPAGSGRAALDAAIASPDLVPRNTTGIGAGMIAGAGTLDAERLTPGTPYQRFALCVMTDGNENENPRVADPPVAAAIAPYSDAIYAIGLGQPGGVSDAVLSSISNYMLITGDITAAERRFRLTKYFVQILAGVTGSAIVVDPQGDLQVGSEHRIPFQLTDADHEVDVIVLSPLAPLLDLSLEAPDGTVIDGGFGAPTVSLHEHLDDVFYRLSLPVTPAVAHAGKWTAVLHLSRQKLAKHRDDREDWADRIKILSERGTLPYSLVVSSYSDLELQVDVAPTVCLAGEKVLIRAAIRAFGQPLTGRSRVTAQVSDPAGTTTTVTLDPDGAGSFARAFPTTVQGLYSVRVMAIGGAGRSGRFQREETRTVAVFRGEIPKGVGSREDDKARGKPDRGRFGLVPQLLDRALHDLHIDREVLGMQAGHDQAGGGQALPAGGGGADAGGQGDAGDDVAAFGLTEQAAAAAQVGEPGQAPMHEHGAPAGGHEAHDHPVHDHEHMFFAMFRRNDAGEVVEVAPADITRDTSQYDEEGHDPGTGEGPVTPPPGAPSDEHHH